MKRNNNDLSEAKILKSTAPLPEELPPMMIWYVIAIILSFVFLFMLNPLFFAAVIGFIVIRNIEKKLINQRAHDLKLIKFKLRDGVTADAILLVVQSVLVEQYKMTAEKHFSGCVSVTHKKYTYDIIIGSDETFTLDWRPVNIKNQNSKVKYGVYKTLLSDMGIIAYVVQKAFLESYTHEMNNTYVEDDSSEWISVTCTGCGGLNRIKYGAVEECEFCGLPIKSQ